MLKVEKGIPVPLPRSLEKRFPLLDLEVGDSFLIPLDDPLDHGGIYRVAQRLKIKVTMKVNCKGVRVWRIK